METDQLLEVIESGETQEVELKQSFHSSQDFSKLMSGFAEHPGFRKRYPRGSFWSQYEHHQSIGWKSKKDAENYIPSQLTHHNIRIIDDRQQRLSAFAAEQDTASLSIARI